MAEELKKPDDLLDINLSPPAQGWMETTPTFRKGTYCYSAPLKHQQYLELPNQREWQPHDADWKLPANWKEIILDGMEKLLKNIAPSGSFSISVSGVVHALTSAITLLAQETLKICLYCGQNS